MEYPSFVASGDITASRFVIGVPGSPGYAAPAVGASSQVIGVSQEGTYYPPGLIGTTPSALAAPDGKSFRVYAPGEETLLECGGTVSANTFLRSDSVGRGVTADLTVTATPTWVGFYTLDSGTTGSKVRGIVRQFSAIAN